MAAWEQVSSSISELDKRFTKTDYLRHWPDVCGNDADKRERAFKVYQENRRNQKDVCPNTCLNTNVFFGPLVSGRNEKDKAVGIILMCRVFLDDVTLDINSILPLYNICNVIKWELFQWQYFAESDRSRVLLSQGCQEHL